MAAKGEAVLAAVQISCTKDAESCPKYAKATRPPIQTDLLSKLRMRCRLVIRLAPGRGSAVLLDNCVEVIYDYVEIIYDWMMDQRCRTFEPHHLGRCGVRDIGPKG